MKFFKINKDVNFLFSNLGRLFMDSINLKKLVKVNKKVKN